MTDDRDQLGDSLRLACHDAQTQILLALDLNGLLESWRTVACLALRMSADLAARIESFQSRCADQERQIKLLCGFEDANTRE
jgi:hypothetical protein